MVITLTKLFCTTKDAHFDSKGLFRDARGKNDKNFKIVQNNVEKLVIKKNKK